MKTVVVYPSPLETREVRDIFLPFVTRFANSLREFDPGCEYELAVIENGGDEESIKDCRAQFHGLPATFHRYDGKGCDIGSFQHYARNIATENVFQVCCVTRCYAHRNGWLKELVEAREFWGPGLFGTSASREGGKFHFCTRAYAFDASDFKQYPTQIISRDQGTYFEVYDGNLHEWFRARNQATVLVWWSGDVNLTKARNPINEFYWPNGYRNGDQSEMLLWDKHSQAYAYASPEEKLRLEKLCFEGTP